MTLRDFAYLGGQITEQLTTSQSTYTRYLYTAGGNLYATLKVDVFNGKAEFDYAPILRTMLKPKGTAPVLISGCDRSYTVGQLQVTAMISSSVYKFIRGVSPDGVSRAEKNKFMTKMPALRHYKGYPLSISYIFNEDNSGVMKNIYLSNTQGHGGSLENTNALYNIQKGMLTTDLTVYPHGITEVDAITARISYNYYTYPYLDDQGPTGKPYRWGEEGGTIRLTTMRNPSAGASVWNADNPTGSSIGTVTDTTTHVVEPYDMDGVITLTVNYATADTRPVSEMPIPAHPFYVRWINSLGGYDYFMFACNHKDTRKLAKNETYEKYGSAGVRSSYYKEAQETIEVSSGIVDRQTLEALAELMYSPLIELYDKSAETWTEIQVNDGKSDIMEEQPTGEMIMTFELPTPQMNK